MKLKKKILFFSEYYWMHLLIMRTCRCEDSLWMSFWKIYYYTSRFHPHHHQTIWSMHSGDDDDVRNAMLMHKPTHTNVATILLDWLCVSSLYGHRGYFESHNRLKFNRSKLINFLIVMIGWFTEKSYNFNGNSQIQIAVDWIYCQDYDKASYFFTT